MRSRAAPPRRFACSLRDAALTFRVVPRCERHDPSVVSTCSTFCCDVWHITTARGRALANTQLRRM
eukprot:291174-Prorocentrum_minimum.AAC.2